MLSYEELYLRIEQTNNVLELTAIAKDEGIKPIPTTDWGLKTVLKKYIEAQPDITAASKFQSVDRLTMIAMQVGTVKPVDEVALAAKILDQVIARRSEIGLVDPATLKALTGEVLNEMAAETAFRPVSEDRMREILHEEEVRRAKELAEAKNAGEAAKKGNKKANEDDDESEDDKSEDDDKSKKGNKKGKPGKKGWGRRFIDSFRE